MMGKRRGTRNGRTRRWRRTDEEVEVVKEDNSKEEVEEGEGRCGR